MVLHTAVLASIADPTARGRFAQAVRGLGAAGCGLGTDWISDEAPGVVSAIAARRHRALPPGAFVDGVPAGWTQPNAAWRGPKDVAT
jgi:hypothetical protein